LNYDPDFQTQESLIVTYTQKTQKFKGSKDKVERTDGQTDVDTDYFISRKMRSVTIEKIVSFGAEVNSSNALCQLTRGM